MHKTEAWGAAANQSLDGFITDTNDFFITNEFTYFSLCHIYFPNWPKVNQKSSCEQPVDSNQLLNMPGL